MMTGRLLGFRAKACLSRWRLLRCIIILFFAHICGGEGWLQPQWGGKVSERKDSKKINGVDQLVIVFFMLELYKISLRLRNVSRFAPVFATDVKPMVSYVMSRAPQLRNCGRKIGYVSGMNIEYCRYLQYTFQNLNWTQVLWSIPRTASTHFSPDDMIAVCIGWAQYLRQIDDPFMINQQESTCPTLHTNLHQYIKPI